MRVVNEAAQAPNLASTLNQGAFNLGNAAGAWVGGLALTEGLAYRELPWIGVALAVVAFTLSFLSHRLDARACRRRCAGRRAMTVESTSVGSDSHSREFWHFTWSQAKVRV